MRLRQKDRARPEVIATDLGRGNASAIRTSVLLTMVRSSRNGSSGPVRWARRIRARSLPDSRDAASRPTRSNQRRHARSLRCTTLPAARRCLRSASGWNHGIQERQRERRGASVAKERAAGDVLASDEHVSLPTGSRPSALALERARMRRPYITVACRFAFCIETPGC